MSKEEPKKCPFCGSYRFEQPLSNSIARGVSGTIGFSAGFTLALAGSLFTLGRAGDWFAKKVSSNVVEPIMYIVQKEYLCKSCGKTFTK